MEIFTMIEFKGYLTGNAEKRFFKRSVIYAQTQSIIGILLALTLIPVLIKYLHLRVTPGLILDMILGVGATVLLFIILVRIPQSAKAKRTRTPRRILVDEEMIICVADKYVEARKIRDVKKVRDCGEFYEVVFSLEKFSEKFICQKNLLVEGTLEEFEQLFEGGIERRS